MLHMSYTSNSAGQKKGCVVVLAMGEYSKVVCYIYEDPYAEKVNYYTSLCQSNYLDPCNLEI